MFVVSENEHTEKSIKEELERLFIAAGYINADRGDLETAMHLISAAIAELEVRTEQRMHPEIPAVQGKKGPTG